MNSGDSTPQSTRKEEAGNKSQFCVRFLALAICILAALLIIQVVILVQNATKSSTGPGIEEDGGYATAVTSCGFVKGLVVNDSYAFLGIQYAIPPLGQRRWTAAEVHDDLRHCWNGTYLAIERRKRCWQFYRNGSYDGTEDCLYLDLFTPQLHYQNPLDVIVFVGGDNLNGGENFDLQPSPATAKERNAVFISVSLRRSVLGFLSLKTLSQRSRLKSSGNYGVSDLLASLLWIRHNVHHFGGNLNSVTILGHQSGATILGALLRNDATRSQKLFHRVWMSGGSFLEPVPLEQAEDENLKFLEYTECESLSCLFKLSPEEVLDSVPYTWRQFHHELPQPATSFEPEHFWLTYDGHILKDPSPEDNNDDLETISTDIAYNNIPVVIGSPQHVDASSEMRSYLDWNSTQKYREYLESGFDTLFAIQTYHQYNRPDTNHWQQFSALLSDYLTICPMLKMSRTYFRHNLAFNYITTHRTKGGFGNLAKIGSDIQAIFRPNLKTRSFKEAKFTENMISLFDSFVKTGSMEEKDSAGGGPKILMIDDRIGKVQEYSNCDLWYRYYELKVNKYKSKASQPKPSIRDFVMTTTMLPDISEEGEESEQRNISEN